jgi:hypothetical protein
MQEILEVAYPETNFPAEMDVALLEADRQTLGPVTLIEDDDFVPTADIPELEIGNCFLH